MSKLLQSLIGLGLVLALILFRLSRSPPQDSSTPTSAPSFSAAVIASPSNVATPTPQIVERVVTVVVTVVVTQVVEKVITAIPAPTSTADPIQTTVAQARATATALAPQVATAEAARDIAVAAKQTAEVAAFKATHPPLLGQAFEGKGLSLIALPGPYAVGNHGDWPTGIHFAADNRTGQRLNFNITPSDFYLELSNGRRYPGVSAPIAINGFETNTRYEFDIAFSIIWDNFQAFLRDPAITHYFIATTTFGEGRVTNAKWCDEIRGTPCR